MVRTSVVVCVLVLLGMVGAASAAPVTWTINATLADSRTITGAFVYNADTNTYSSVNVVTSGPGGTTYTQAGLGTGVSLSATTLQLFPAGAVSGSLTGVRNLYLNFLTALTNAGGTRNVSGGQENTCPNGNCTSPGAPSTSVAAGGTVTAPVPAATLTGTKTVAGPFVPGTTVTYTVTLQNTGTGVQADNAGNEFSDVLPSDLTLVSATATSGTATATVGTNTVTWNGSLAASASVTITITATIKGATASGTVVSNQGTISYDGDGNNTNEASAVTDDPGTGAANDPTRFTVAAPPAPPVPVPALPLLGIIALGMMLAATAVWRLRATAPQRTPRPRPTRDR